MTIHPLIKINFAALVILFIAVCLIFKAFSGDPTKGAWKPIKNMKVKKAVVFLIRTFATLLLLGCIVFINIPVLKDTFLATKPITTTGKAEDAGSLFGIFTFWFYQGFSIDNKTYHIVFYPKFIINGGTYKVTYLPYSRHVLTIERLD